MQQNDSSKKKKNKTKKKTGEPIESVAPSDSNIKKEERRKIEKINGGRIPGKRAVWPCPCHKSPQLRG